MVLTIYFQLQLQLQAHVFLILYYCVSVFVKRNSKLFWNVIQDINKTFELPCWYFV